MLKNYFIAAIISLAMVMQSCDGYKKTETGLQYKILVDSAGKNAEMGDHVIMHINYENAKDTLSTMKVGRPATALVQKTFKGGLEEGLMLLSTGDSAEFLISSDSLYTKMFSDSLPKEIKPGSFTHFSLKVLKIVPKEEVKKQQAEMLKRDADMKRMRIDMAASKVKSVLDTSGPQMKIDEAFIKAFIKNNKLDAKKSEKGVYYSITRKGEGPQVAVGDTVAVYYVGKLLDGTVFDSSRAGQPIRLIVGIGQVIDGWDDGLAKLSKGDKATLIIPSPLAYSKRGVKDNNPMKPGNYIIPPSSVLVFDVEILEVKK
jgi:FKBP-type peptidyl-prolyl cis-trans isomerase FkpA